MISDSIPFILHPSPLNDSITEAVLIPESSISIKSEGEGEYVDLESCSITDPMSDEVCRTANKLADEHRENAKRWFSVASGIHSTIEQIYSSCMDFDIADKICESLCLKISNALG